MNLLEKTIVVAIASLILGVVALPLGYTLLKFVCVIAYCW